MAKTQAVDQLTNFARFVNQIGKSTKEIYIGIDPGATGAIGFLCGTSHFVIDIPTMKIPVIRTKKLSPALAAQTGKKTRRQQGSTTEADYAGICAIFRLLKPLKKRIAAVALEKIPKTVGGPWGVTIGDVVSYASYKMWPLYLHARGYVVDEVAPATWKAHYQLSRKSDRRFGKKKVLTVGGTKGLVNTKKPRGPQVKAEGAEASRHKAMVLFPQADLQRKLDHNRAEALLIAEYVRRTHGRR